MLVKWKLVAQLQYYRVLFLFGLKSEEIYYIGGSEALPPPLTREEEEFKSYPQETLRSERC